MSGCRYAIAEVLPHRPPMVLLDELADYGTEGATASVTIKTTSPFCDGQQVPSHVALEYMAQTCGVYVGARALDRGEVVRVGFMLGTRDFVSYVAGFAVGATLRINATMIFNEGEMAAFECRIDVAGHLAASARLSVYQPAIEAAQRSLPISA